MVAGYITNDPNRPVIFPYELSGRGYRALTALGFFYREDHSKIIDRLILEKAAELGKEATFLIQFQKQPER